MPNESSEAGPVSATPSPGAFATTHWSVVLAAGHNSAPGAQEALEKLCRTYWYPLYVYVRRQGQSPHDAQDLTQEFFARLLEKKYLRLADADRGKFRAFLLKSLKHFLVNEWEKARTQKRGGGQCVIPLDAGVAESRYTAEPAQALTIDQVYEKRWALTLIEAVLGTTSTGGSPGYGTIFKVTTNGTLTTLVSFNGGLRAPGLNARKLRKETV